MNQRLAQLFLGSIRRGSLVLLVTGLLACDSPPPAQSAEEGGSFSALESDSEDPAARGRTSMRINVEVDTLTPEEEAVAELRRIERAGEVKIRLGEGVPRPRLTVSIGSLPWPESLLVFAKVNGLRVIDAGNGVMVLEPE